MRRARRACLCAAPAAAQEPGVRFGARSSEVEQHAHASASSSTWSSTIETHRRAGTPMAIAARDIEVQGPPRTAAAPGSGRGGRGAPHRQRARPSGGAARRPAEAPSTPSRSRKRCGSAATAPSICRTWAATIVVTGGGGNDVRHRGHQAGSPSERVPGEGAAAGDRRADRRAQRQRGGAHRLSHGATGRAASTTRYRCRETPTSSCAASPETSASPA